MNSEATIQNMIRTQDVIAQPAYCYFGVEELKQELAARAEKLQGSLQQRKPPVRYRTRAQMEEEKEELAIAEQLDNLQTVQDLTTLMREGKMKEFYQKANALLKIKRNHPVVNKLQKVDEIGETTVFDDKFAVEQEIATYFTQVYRRPEHMMLQPS